MRRTQVAMMSLMATVMLVSSGCTPEELEGVGRTIGQLIMWWLWGMLPPHP